MSDDLTERLQQAFTSFSEHLRPRSRKALLQFLEERDDRMYALLRGGREPEARALYFVPEDTLHAFGLRASKQLDNEDKRA